MPVCGAAAWAALPFAKSFAPPSVGVTSTVPPVSATLSLEIVVQEEFLKSFAVYMTKAHKNSCLLL